MSRQSLSGFYNTYIGHYTTFIVVCFIWTVLGGISVAASEQSEPVNLNMEDEWHRQFLALEHDLARRDHFDRIKAQAFRSEALIIETDRDPADVVLRRTAALMEDLVRSTPGACFDEYNNAWQNLDADRLRIEVDDLIARYNLYIEACRLRRQIAFSNPILDFDEVVFIKRHRALFDHMVDQYAGIAATPGGGLFVLENAFGVTPHIRDVLADAVVERGRLKGECLCGGPSTPPELSYDGLGTRHGNDTGGGSLQSKSNPSAC